MNKIINQLFFIAYFILLIWIIIFKLETNMVNFLDHYYFRNINTIPYKYYSPQEVILNILIFIPFGIYVKSIFKNLPFVKIVFWGFLLSLFFESCQYFLAVGHSDITDLIDNTLGTIIGIVIYKIILFIFKEKTILFLNIVSTITTFFLFFTLKLINII